MTTASEKQAIQAAAQDVLDKANALTVGPTQEELDAANAQIAALTSQLATANATITTLLGKIASALIDLG